MKFYKILQKQKFLRRAFQDTDGMICLNHNLSCQEYLVKRKRKKFYVKDLNLKLNFVYYFARKKLNILMKVGKYPTCNKQTNKQRVLEVSK